MHDAPSYRTRSLERQELAGSADELQLRRAVRRVHEAEQVSLGEEVQAHEPQRGRDRVTGGTGEAGEEDLGGLAGEPLRQRVSVPITPAAPTRAKLSTKLTGVCVVSSLVLHPLEVKKTARALGIDDRALLERSGELEPLFKARNEVSHELDLQELECPGDRTRRGRGMAATAEMCSGGA
jgi:hypothetical protein